MESPPRPDNPSPEMEMFEEHQPESLLDVDDPNLPLPPLRRTVTHTVLPKKRAIEDLTVSDIEDDDELDIPETEGSRQLFLKLQFSKLAYINTSISAILHYRSLYPNPTVNTHVVSYCRLADLYLKRLHATNVLNKLLF